MSSELKQGPLDVSVYKVYIVLIYAVIKSFYYNRGELAMYNDIMRHCCTIQSAVMRTHDKVTIKWFLVFPLHEGIHYTQLLYVLISLLL
jgi:hypothetical protein